MSVHRDSVIVEPMYLNCPTGKLFVTCFKPRTPPAHSKTILCLPPFAEEMNKSRRMLALQGRSLADAGFMFVLPDLFGTGDSEGDFAQASWQTWIDNVGFVADWLQERGSSHMDVLAVRSGVFLCTGIWERARARAATEKVVLWNPVLNGTRMINNLLRTRVVRDSADGRSSRVVDIRGELMRDGGIEIAGYWLTGQLVGAIDPLEVSAVDFPAGSGVLWADVVRAAMDRVPPGIERVQKAWQTEGKKVTYSCIPGPQFWLGPEIEVAPDLLTVTTDFFVAN